MPIHQVKRLIRLHEKATRHAKEYKRLSGDPSRQSNALRHLDKADRLYFQVRALIRDLTPHTAEEWETFVLGLRTEGKNRVDAGNEAQQLTSRSSKNWSPK